MAKLIRLSEAAEIIGSNITSRNIYYMLVLRKILDVPISRKGQGITAPILIPADQIKKIKSMWRRQRCLLSNEFARKLRTHHNLEISPDILSSWAREGKITAEKHGRRWVFDTQIAVKQVKKLTR